MFTLEELTRPYKIVVYGTSGIGKSTLASKAPKAALLDIENGTPHIRIPKKRISSFEELLTSMDGAAKSEFETIVIDSLTYLEKFIFQKVAKDNGKKSIADIPFHKGYDLALTEWDAFLQRMYQLNKTKNVICIAHAQISHIEDPETGAYDEIAPALHKKAVGLIAADFDAVLAMKAQMIVTDEKATVTKNVIIYTQPSSGVMAKSRFNLPEKISRDKFDWSQIIFKY